jgi:hypothetical protein
MPLGAALGHQRLHQLGHAVRHSARTLRIAGQATDSTTSARTGPGLAASSRQAVR